MSAIVRYCGGSVIDNSDSTTVTAKVLHVTAPAKTSYNAGDILDISGIIVTVEYSDGTTKQVDDFSTYPYNGTAISKNTSSVSVNWSDENGTSLASSFDISVKYVTGINVDTLPNKTMYVEGNTIDLTGLVVSAKYSDGTSETISGYTTSPANSAEVSRNDSKVTISYTISNETFNTSYDITVKYVTGIKVTTPPTKTSYAAGDKLSTAGMVVSSVYSDNTTEDITDYTTSPANGAALKSSDTSISISATINNTKYTTSQTITIAPSVAYWGTSSAVEIADFLEKCDAGTYDISSYWSIGDERYMEMYPYSDDDTANVSEDISYVIEDLDGTTSGGTKYHAIIGQKNCLSIGIKMNSSNDNRGGYSNTDMCVYLEGTYESKFPEDLLKLIIPSNHISGNGSSGTQTNNNVKFILHSEKEILGDCVNSIQDEASACKMFKYYAISSNRIKKLGESGIDTNWWLRSSGSGYSYSFCTITGSGSSGSTAAGGIGYCTTENGVAPFACI
jgi:hypothetical protein